MTQGVFYTGGLCFDGPWICEALLPKMLRKRGSVGEGVAKKVCCLVRRPCPGKGSQVERPADAAGVAL